MKRFMTVAALAAAMTGGLAFAQEEPVRASEYRSDTSGPQIIIRNQEDRTYYEYRVNGVLREIRVVPEVGSPYYLVPANGGFIRQDESQLLVPSWVIFNW